MAERGDLTSIKAGSDADFEYTCSPCGEAGIREQADKYCPVCQDYLCAACTQYHARLKSTRPHTLLNSNVSTKAPGVTMVTKCHNHPEFDIEMYCGQHDMVFCAKCIATEHRACSGVTSLEDVENSTNQENEIERLKIETRNLDKRLEDTGQKTQTNIDSVRVQRDNVTSKIKGLERNLVEHIRKLKNEALETLKKEYELVKEELESNMSVVNKGKQKIEAASLHLQTVDSLDKRQKFIQSKLVQKAINDTLKILGKYEAKGCQYLSSEEDTKLTSSIIATTSLWSVQKVTEGKSLTKKKSKIYKIKSEREVNVKMKNDMHGYYITDICQLQNGTIILADYCNGRVMRLDVNYNMKDCFDVGGNPKGICCTGNTEVAVKLHNKNLLYLSAESSLSKLSREFTK